MIERVIDWCIGNRVLVLIGSVILAGWGMMAVRQTPTDAIPDLSDVQVIIKTSFPGQAPQVVEDQVTYPLTTAMLAVPKAVTVRGYSFFGDSFVYVIFEDGTDLYWARSRVLEYLSQVSSALPANVKPSLGPDATGVGWVYSYALVDRSGEHDLAELRSLQDWYLRFELQAVPGVAEVASIGGMVKQYQVVIDPNRLRAYGIPLSHIRTAIQRANSEAGASVIELAEAEYMVRASGYIDGVEALEQVPLGMVAGGSPLLLGDIADVIEGPQMRRGVADLDGEGEVVGAVVVMRYGENAERTIAGVKAKLEALRRGLPPGVEIVETYDRSSLIERAVANLYEKVTEEFVAVALVCALFLLHFRSALVVLVSLPLGILTGYVVMYHQGINANIMSLGGIAIAIGAMVDGAIVMIENAHRHLERADEATPRWAVVKAAATEVGPALFFSLLIITVSFLPVFALEAQEGRLFKPLAFTKTYAMAAAAGLSVTLVPVLVGYFVRGKLPTAERNPLNRWTVRAYRPLIEAALARPGVTLGVAGVAVLIGLVPVTRLGSEFMPPLDEGDLLYMPTTYAGISIGKARELLQQTDRIIRTVPEVRSVFGKAGRADTATDPAPLTMLETTIRLAPRSEWRDGLTTEALIAELDAKIRFPGLSNAWVMPIRNRIDMLATGIKTPVGIKVAGPDLEVIETIGRRLEQVMPNVRGTASVYSERVAGGRYVKVDIDRARAARYGLNIDDVQTVIRTAIGGTDIIETVEGLERYPVNLRYPPHYRDSVEQMRKLPLVTASNERLALGDVAEIYVDDGPPAIKSENARLNGWTFIDIKDRDLGSYVAEARRLVSRAVDIPPGYSLSWAGQYEYLQRAQQRLMLVVPATLLMVVLLLYLSFRNMLQVALVIGTLPVALVGGVAFVWMLGYQLSVAVGVGFIALAGVAIEIGVLMMLYLNQARGGAGYATREAIVAGATRRLRPILMTSIATIAGLVPIMVGSGTGSEVMQRIAAPMVGGMVTTLLLGLLVLPAGYLLVYPDRRERSEGDRGGGRRGVV